MSVMMHMICHQCRQHCCYGQYESKGVAITENDLLAKFLTIHNEHSIVSIGDSDKNAEKFLEGQYFDFGLTFKR